MCCRVAGCASRCTKVGRMGCMGNIGASKRPCHEFPVSVLNAIWCNWIATLVRISRLTGNQPSLPSPFRLAKTALDTTCLLSALGTVT